MDGALCAWTSRMSHMLKCNDTYSVRGRTEEEVKRRQGRRAVSSPTTLFSDDFVFLDGSDASYPHQLHIEISNL
jgi:hypothetical protein